MQYGLNGEIIKNTRKDFAYKSNVQFENEQLRIVCISVITFLLSRVVLYIGEGDKIGIAPFGIVFLISVIMTRKEGRIIFASIGAFLGYFTIMSDIKDVSWYIGTILFFLVYSILASKKNIKQKLGVMYFIIFFTQIIYGFLSGGYSIGLNLTLAGINTAITIPIYYVINYGLVCISEYNSNYFFNLEELISISIILCLMVSGVGEVSILGISLRSVLGYFMIITIAYIGGVANGAAIGVAMGIIIGISSGEMILGIGFYSVIGLVCGLFKETGRLFSFLATMLIYFILALYTKDLSIASSSEILLSGVLFLALPKVFLDSISAEIDNEVKGEFFNQNHLVQVKSEFSRRVEVLGEGLDLISKSIKEMSENNNLSYKNKSVELVDSLSCRVCENCKKANKCWKNNFNQTYIAFERLIQSREEEHPEFPSYLEEVCENKRKLIRNVEEIINVAKIEELEKRRMEEGRKIVSEHISNISKSIDSMFFEFKNDVTWCGDLERIIRKELTKNSIKHKDIFCYTDNTGKLKVKINMESCLSGNYCSKNILPIINNIVKTPMSLSDDGCRINPTNKECTVTLTEVPKYKVISYAGMSPKEGEKFTGDSYTFGKANDGKYITILSDGMGSGPEANKESKITVDLVEKFLQSGFDVNTSLNTINSIMCMKFDESEKYSTLDMNIIDLYTGKIKFYKVGGTTSFIKRGNTVKKISSNMPPLGLVDEVEIEGVEEKIKDGDYIITLSDGVLDVDKNEVGNSIWLENYLKGNKSTAKELVTGILEESKRVNGGKIKDDMTVVVSKVNTIY